MVSPQVSDGLVFSGRVTEENAPRFSEWMALLLIRDKEKPLLAWETSLHGFFLSSLLSCMADKVCICSAFRKIEISQEERLG